MAFFSATLTVGTSPLPVTNDKIGITKVKQASIVVRSMGTATYIGLGGRDSQDRRLTVAGSSLSIEPIAQDKYVHLNEIFCSSDTADAVIEIIGESYDHHE